MNKRVVFPLGVGVLIVGLLLAAGWAYWNEPPSGDAWVVEQPEQIVSGAEAGEELHVAFVLRNNSSQPLRILGTDAC